MPNYDFQTDLEVVARQTALYLDSLPDAKPLQDTTVNIDSMASVQSLVKEPLKSLKGKFQFSFMRMYFSRLFPLKYLLSKNIKSYYC